MNLETLFSRFEPELRQVEEHLADIFSSDALIIPAIGSHIISGGGKRLRPLFLILSAELAGYKNADRALLGGIIEAIHTASLLHDDVVDGAEIRRGKKAAHILWGNQVVILVGDFLYSNALRIAVLRKNQRIMETLSEATTMMTEGEILQLNRLADPEITEDEYFRIISAKTGALISAACRIGGILGDISQGRQDALAKFGMKTGIAFQLADDILDYMAEERELGKRLGKDLDEGKITLPLIYLLKDADEEEKAGVKALIKKDSLEQEDLARILKSFDKYSVIERSLRSAQRLIQEAKECLAAFPNSEVKEALTVLSDYALAREK